MRRAHAIVIPLLVMSSVAPVRAQERRAPTPLPAAKPRAAQKRATAATKDGATRTRTPDFKIVFWFGATGMKHQVYDVRKGQYTKAVDDWVNERTFDASGFARPGRLAVVREVYLGDEAGRTEREKLESAIERHERRILGIGRAVEGRPRDRSPLFPLPLNHSSNDDHARRDSDRFRPVSPGYGPGRYPPPGQPAPFPIPYPRPHP